MVPIGTSTMKKCLMVAASEWRSLIREKLPGMTEEVVWCGNVYEAVATAAELDRPGGGVLVFVMVDYLTAAEMEVFAVLAGMRSVTAVALSAFGSAGKLATAKWAGARDGLVLGRDDVAHYLDMVYPAENVGAGGKAVEASGQSKVPPSEATATDPAVPAAEGPRRTVEESLAELAATAISLSEANAVKAKPQVPARMTPRRTPPGRELGEPVLTKAEMDALLGS
jgi:hypothetical protein